MLCHCDLTPLAHCNESLTGWLIRLVRIILYVLLLSYLFNLLLLIIVYIALTLQFWLLAL